MWESVTLWRRSAKSEFQAGLPPVWHSQNWESPAPLKEDQILTTWERVCTGKNSIVHVFVTTS